MNRRQRKQEIDRAIGGIAPGGEGFLVLAGTIYNREGRLSSWEYLIAHYHDRQAEFYGLPQYYAHTPLSKYGIKCRLGVLTESISSGNAVLLDKSSVRDMKQIVTLRDLR